MNSFLIPADETPEQAEKRKKMTVAQALLRPPQNVGEGIAALGTAILQRQQLPQNQFPAAPGGVQPSFMRAMKNMMGVKSGGLY